MIESSKLHLDYDLVIMYNDYQIVVATNEVDIVVRGGLEKMRINAIIKNPFTLGQIIQQSRLQKGFSQRELASMLGISQKWVWEMEQGKPGILMDRLFKILGETGVTLRAEFEAEGVPTNE